MTSEYIHELAERAFATIVDDAEWKEFLPKKPANALELERELKSHALLQARIAWHIRYTPSKWLLENELNEIKTRRDQFEIAWVDQKGNFQGGNEKEKAERGKEAAGTTATTQPDIDPYRQAERSRLMGICFSGGGIRSATFNLGILQGLAKLNLLRCFDYLSSVSGGGYIHQWLAAWISRQSKIAAAKQAFQNVNSYLVPLPEDDSPQSHPEPIRWLRRYSNYLTPQKGFFTADTWVTFATWLRNTLLNQVILVSALIVVMLLPHLFTFGWFVPSKHWSIVATIAAIVYLFLAAVAMMGRDLYLLEVNPEPAAQVVPNQSSGRKVFLDQLNVQTLVVLPLLVASFLLTLILSLGVALQDYIYALAVIPILFIVLTLTITFAGRTLTSYLRAHQFIGLNENARDFWDQPWCVAHVRAIFAFLLMILAALIIGLGGALWDSLILLKALTLQHSLAIDAWRLELVLGPPLLLSGPLLAVLFLIGLIGRSFKDSRREWLARLGAWTGLYALIWILLVGCSLFGYVIFKWLICQLWAGIPALVAWVGTSGLAIIAGTSDKTTGARDDKAPSKVSRWEIVAQVGPYVFAAGLLILLAAAAECLIHGHGTGYVLIVMLAGTFIALLLGMRVDINDFSMHAFYRDRLARCYLGASNQNRNANPFTGFDEEDSNIPVSSLTASQGYLGPYPIFCTTLNLTFGEDLAWQERKGASFAFAPLFSGYDVGWTAASDGEHDLRFNGFVETATYAYPKPGIHISTAAAISGAALSPNWGYHSDPATAFLLTLFNVRLGWWLRNPRTIAQNGTRLSSGQGAVPRLEYPWPSPRFSLVALTNELLGLTNDTSSYLYLTDGGHFDNMGLYELVRRRCRYIVICDGEEDGQLTFEGIGMAIRKCRIDFGAEISLDLRPLQHLDDGNSGAHCVVGTIRYPEDQYVKDLKPGIVVYIKSSLTGDEPADVMNYKREDPCFPHDSTLNQWFTESQFESYRRLGHHVALSIFTPADSDDLCCSKLLKREAYFGNLRTIWTPFTPEMQQCSPDHSKSYGALLQAIRADTNLPGFFDMLYQRDTTPKTWRGNNRDFDYAVRVSSQLIEFIFIVYFQLKLVYPENLNHPFAQGWLEIFRSWSTIDVIKEAWHKYGPGYTPAFQIFAQKQIGMPRLP